MDRRGWRDGRSRGLAAGALGLVLLVVVLVGVTATRSKPADQGEGEAQTQVDAGTATSGQDSTAGEEVGQPPELVDGGEEALHEDGGSQGGPDGDGSQEPADPDHPVVAGHREASLTETARQVLEAYRDADTPCVLVRSGYLDVTGHAWGCVVEGDGWVDVCEVVPAVGGGSDVRLTRMDRDEWAQTAPEAQ